MMPRPLVLAFGLGVLFVAGSARAEPDPAAEQLFAEGRALMAEKKYALACPKLEASQRLDPGAGTLLNLAGCYELAGKTASAWLTYRDAESAAERSSRGDWARTAHDRAGLLLPKLSYLSIIVVERSEGLVVERDGHAVDAAVWGIAVPTDPGPHTIRASAPGYEPWSTTVDVRARDEVQVGPLVPVKSLVASPPRPARAAPTSWSTQRTLAVGAGGVGIAGLVVGAVFGLKAKSTYDDALANECHADPRTCSANGVDHVSTSHRQATASTVAVVAGGVFIAGGAILFFTAPQRNVAVGLAGSSVALRAKF